MNPIVKICGLTSPEALDAALAAGADMVGLVRFEKSPRHLDLEQGRALSLRARGRAERLALVVDADDAARIRGITIVDAQGSRSQFTFDAFKENVGLKDSLFRFEVPRGVEVVSG